MPLSISFQTYLHVYNRNCKIETKIDLIMFKSLITVLRVTVSPASQISLTLKLFTKAIFQFVSTLDKHKIIFFIGDKMSIWNWNLGVYFSIKRLRKSFKWWMKKLYMPPSENLSQCSIYTLSSVTRLGDLLDFRQVSKAFGNNQFAKISHILRQFL